MTFTHIQCPKYNALTNITFDVVNTSTMNKQEYTISLMRECSLCQNICQHCPFLDLVGKSTDRI